MNQIGRRVDKRGSTGPGVSYSLAKNPLSSSILDRGNGSQRVHGDVAPGQSKFSRNPLHQDTPKSLSRLVGHVHLDPQAKVFQADTQPVFDADQKGHLAYLPAFENIQQGGHAQNAPASHSYKQYVPLTQSRPDYSQASPSGHYFPSSPIAPARETGPAISPELEAQFLWELKQIRDNSPPNKWIERQIVNPKNAGLTGFPKFDKLSSILNSLLEQEKSNIDHAHKLLSARGWKQVAPQLMDRELYDTENAKEKFLTICERIRKTAPSLVDLDPSIEMLFCMEVESRINLYLVQAQGKELRKQLRISQRSLMQQHEKVNRDREIFFEEYPEVLRRQRELQDGMRIQSSLVKNGSRFQVDRATQTWEPVKQESWVASNVHYQRANSNNDAHAGGLLQQSNLNTTARHDANASGPRVGPYSHMLANFQPHSDYQMSELKMDTTAPRNVVAAPSRSLYSQVGKSLPEINENSSFGAHGTAVPGYFGAQYSETRGNLHQQTNRVAYQAAPAQSGSPRVHMNNWTSQQNTNATLSQGTRIRAFPSQDVRNQLAREEQEERPFCRAVGQPLYPA